MKEAILIQTFGEEEFIENKLRTDIHIITQENNIIQLFSISETDPQDKSFKRDLDGMEIMGEKWFEVFSQYKLVKHINIPDFDYKTNDVRRLSFEFLMKYDV